MSELTKSILSHVLSFGVGVIAVYVYIKFLVSKANVSAEKIINEAQIKADNLVKEAILDAKTKAYELKLEAEKEIKNERKELTNYENKLLQREQNIDRRDIVLQGKEESLEHKAQSLEKKRTELDRMEIVLEEKIEAKIVELEKVSQMTVNEAKQELFKIVEAQCLNETTQYIKEEEESAKAEAASKAREIISLAIARYAQETTTERTVSVVSLPSEEMKGRIIGREGRNIRALEQATGVDLIIDDTPEAITISCFDPIRREIAKNALNILIRDGRIQPGRIEEVVERVKSELDENMREAGEDAVFKLGLSKVNKELVQMIGRLKYRSSYGQNALQHSIEVGYLAGIMASEIGVNPNLAKRAGLLHDIGKAVSYEVEGSHVEIGVKLAKKYSEHKVVINAIASHHGDTEATDVISVLVAAADTLSAARPGARSETLENYVQRLEKLEAIANDFEGIDRTFAIQAGREIRVVVVPEKVDDLGCHHIAREIKKKIESELAYPGVIKVTVVREVRVSETAK